MGESLIRQITFAEAEIEVSRDELREFAKKGDYDEITRVADRLAGELKALATLREKASAQVYRNLAKEVAAQLMRMAKKTERQAIAAIEPPQENEGDDHAVGPVN